MALLSEINDVDDEYPGYDTRILLYGLPNSAISCDLEWPSTLLTYCKFKKVQFLVFLAADARCLRQLSFLYFITDVCTLSTTTHVNRPNRNDYGFVFIYTRRTKTVVAYMELVSIILSDISFYCSRTLEYYSHFVCYRMRVFIVDFYPTLLLGIVHYSWQEAQLPLLPQRDRVTRYVTKFVQCFTRYGS